jgi:hypothetical protein
LDEEQIPPEIRQLARYAHEEMGPEVEELWKKRATNISLAYITASLTGGYYGHDDRCAYTGCYRYCGHEVGLQ